MTYEEWIRFGMEMEWCGPPVCEVHDGLPTSWVESEILLMGEDVCVEIIRVYPDKETKNEVEENHAASTWRKHEWLSNTQSN